MILHNVIGILIPFIGTTAGAACVFLMKKKLPFYVQKALIGFASGIMIAASVWSLLIPSIDQSEKMNMPAWLPAVIGFLCGIGFLLILDMIIPHMHQDEVVTEGPKVRLPKTTKMLLAVTLHNIPEGLAVGVLYAGLLSESNGISFGAVMALSLGIAIQNFPEGAIVSLPLCSEGMSRKKAFWGGMLSGAVEPVAAVIALFATGAVSSSLPYCLSFAAGAMMYVVIEELIPEMSHGKHSNIGVVFFALGFCLMMVLDISLG